MKNRFNQSFLLVLLLLATSCAMEKDAIEGRWEFCKLVKWSPVERMSISGNMKTQVQQTWETERGLTILVYISYPATNDTAVGKVQKILVTR